MDAVLNRTSLPAALFSGLAVLFRRMLFVARDAGRLLTLLRVFDSGLPLPCSADTYLNASFPLEQMNLAFHPLFRLIDASTFLTTFSSDRRHMRTDDDWLCAPPPWPCIRGDTDDPHTLSRFITMDSSNHGELMTLQQLRHVL